VHQCKAVAGADTIAEAVNGVFEDTTGGIVAVSSIFITAAKETELSNAFEQASSIEDACNRYQG
jgi:hypothetical protein